MYVSITTLYLFYLFIAGGYYAIQDVWVYYMIVSVLEEWVPMQCPVDWGEISMKQSVGKCKHINF